MSFIYFAAWMLNGNDGIFDLGDVTKTCCSRSSIPTHFHSRSFKKPSWRARRRLKSYVLPFAATIASCGGTDHRIHIDRRSLIRFSPYRAPIALVKALKEEGCNVLEKIDESEYGKFAWVIDPEGNKVELWQPPQGQ